ncbi:transmembrane protein 182-like [Aplochiton taeniatus]
MRVGAVALAGGLFGALGTLCFLLAFGTDYWLLASDDCGLYAPDVPPVVKETHSVNGTEVAPPSLTLHHEGFFWRCVFQADATVNAVVATLFTNQPETKLCIHGYLFPLPVAVGHVPHPSYDSTAVFRGFWTLLIILGVVSALTGGLLLLCAVPFTSPKLYRLGGAFQITAALLFLLLVVLYVLWAELVDVRRYVLQERGESCPGARVSVLYGWSFMVAASGVPLELLAGLLFMFVGIALRVSK